MTAHERIGFSGQHEAGVRAALLVVSLVPVWIFWSLTPLLLVRDGGRGWKYHLLAGFAGVVIDGIVITAVVRVGFPILLLGWTGFGPIGVAMTLMTWCGVIATGWVVIACTSAILWERIAPAEIHTGSTERRILRLGSVQAGHSRAVVDRPAEHTDTHV